MKADTSTKNSVLVERLFDAPVEILWQIWTEPEYILQWFGSDPNGTVSIASIDLRVGGKYEIRFSDSNGSEHTAFGEFLVVDPGSRLQYSWEWLSEPGQISEVQVEFIPVAEQTKLILVHKNLHPDSRHGYLQGWNGALDKIEKLKVLAKK